MGSIPAAPHDTAAVIPHSSPSIPATKPAVPAAYVPAVAIGKAYPTVPDRMMTSSWHTTFRGQFTVHPDGTATAWMVASTGFPVLDKRAMDAARRWKFRPARRNGRAVASNQPFAFAYDVHAAQ